MVYSVEYTNRTRELLFLSLIGGFILFCFLNMKIGAVYFQENVIKNKQVIAMANNIFKKLLRVSSEKGI